MNRMSHEIWGNLWINTLGSQVGESEMESRMWIQKGSGRPEFKASG